MARRARRPTAARHGYSACSVAQVRPYVLVQRVVLESSRRRAPVFPYSRTGPLTRANGRSASPSALLRLIAADCLASCHALAHALRCLTPECGAANRKAYCRQAKETAVSYLLASRGATASQPFMTPRCAFRAAPLMRERT